MRLHRLCSVALVGILLAAPAGQAYAQGRVVAYEVAPGAVGNQADFNGALGMDFDVVLDVVVHRLGAFDSSSDGLARTIDVRLFDRDTMLEVAALQFTPEDQGELVGGSRFKALAAPLELAAGFHGVIAAEGYGAGEPNGNIASGPREWTTNDGGCSIAFVGSGRWGDPGALPPNADLGPVNRFAAGTFEFEPTESFPAPTPAIAYIVPFATLGNQNYGGSLGMDFNVNTYIAVTSLGVFDSNSDGLATTITAHLYDRDTLAALTTLTFTPEDPGDLDEGSRFKDLPSPVVLRPGQRVSIVAEGYSDVEMNGNQNIGPLPLTMDHGGCAISFVGGGRFGDAGSYPATPDDGPQNAYAAGTFAFEPTEPPPDPPPAPPLNLTATAGNAQVVLSWEPPLGDPPAATYRVYRATSAAGPFAQIIQLAATTHTDTGRANDANVCYRVTAVSATNKESDPSAIRCAVPTAGPPAGTIAYVVPQGTPGTQGDFSGQLGLDFDVEADIRVTHLGVFDDNSDGLSAPIAARIFDRDTLLEVASAQFATDDAGSLFGGSRFKPLASPLDLPAGFHGTMAASNYGGTERNGNTFGGAAEGFGWSTDHGDCRISFVGGGRFGLNPDAFPDTPDGGPANRYAAGSFIFEALGPPFVPPVLPPLNVHASASETSVTLSWEAQPASECIVAATGYRVLRSANGGAFTAVADVPGLEYVDTSVTAGVDYCYVVRSLAPPAQVSPDSLTTCASLGKVIAYEVPGGSEGTDITGMALGMDFNVNLDIRVTRLGVFDSGADGLALPLTARLYDRDSMTEVASLTFDGGDPGTLLGGSRFKPLDDPIDLPAGFHGVIVGEGYGDGEPAGATGAWFTNQGPCSVSYVGRGRTGDAGTFPAIPNPAGPPPNVYAAGTFEFEPTETATPRGAIAYVVPAGTFGNQNFDGHLGLDFNVNTDIRVIRLGVFDSGSDGLALPITARLYDREAQTELALLTFTTEDPGELVGGSRFKDLDPPVSLPAGFRGTMAAIGYGDEELNGNQGNGDVLLSSDDGGCAIIFTGGGRFGDPLDLDAFPAIVDGGPVDRYAAGTFEFELEDGGEPVFLRGDTTAEGNLNITDGVNIFNWLFLGGSTPTCLEAANPNDAVTINITSGVYLLNFLFLGGPAPPAPGPPAPGGANPCGLDPPNSPSNLGCLEYNGCPGG